MDFLHSRSPSPLSSPSEIPPVMLWGEADGSGDGDTSAGRTPSTAQAPTKRRTPHSPPVFLLPPNLRMSSLTSPTDTSFKQIPLSPVRRSTLPSYHHGSSPARGPESMAHGLTKVPLSPEGKRSVENVRERRARPEPLVIRPRPERGRTVELFNYLHVNSARRERTGVAVASAVKIQVTQPQLESGEESGSGVEAGSVPLPKTPESGSSGMRTAQPPTSRRIGRQRGDGPGEAERESVYSGDMVEAVADEVPRLGVDKSPGWAEFDAGVHTSDVNVAAVDLGIG
ncbi:hypothetical protein IAT38_000692 [Cryptococcus sp. DSM 104549]